MQFWTNNPNKMYEISKKNYLVITNVLFLCTVPCPYFINAQPNMPITCLADNRRTFYIYSMMSKKNVFDN